MTKAEILEIDSPIGRQRIDASGSPIGVARMDADKSYAGIGKLLQQYINEADLNAWEEIKSKIDYTYVHLDLALAPVAEAIFFRCIRWQTPASGFCFPCT